jgi:hypothetical protein
MLITKQGLMMLPLLGGLSIYVPTLANTLVKTYTLEKPTTPSCSYVAEANLDRAPENFGEMESITGGVDASAMASFCLVQMPAWAVAQEANALRAWKNRYLNQCPPFEQNRRNANAEPSEAHWAYFFKHNAARAFLRSAPSSDNDHEIH